jgi:O-methyltransferase
VTIRLPALYEWLTSEHSETTSRERINALTPSIIRVCLERIPGDFVELGCYRGATSVWLRSVLDCIGDEERSIHVFDSFQGMPTPKAVDLNHVGEGDLVASPDDVLEIHRRWGRKPPTVHPGWFKDTLPTELPEQIAFAYLDGDFYDSIMVSLEQCVPRLAIGAIVVIDDYADVVRHPKAWNGLPGVKQACDEFFGLPSPVQPVVTETDLPFGIYIHQGHAK